MSLIGRKKKKKEDSNSEWTSFEFVQHLIKHPDTSDDTFVMMYEIFVWPGEAAAFAPDLDADSSSLSSSFLIGDADRRYLGF